ncbi:MAG: glycosyltransferase family 4 protein [Candidatus Micrarchaeota archaeon]
MKIAMVCPFFLPVVGGMEKHVYNLSLELQKKGHKVTVFTSAIDHSGREIEIKDEIINGIHVRRYKPWFRIGKFASAFPGFVLDLLGFDIIHAHNMRHPHVELSLWASKLRGIPLALTPHSPYHEGTRGNALEFAVKAYDLLQSFYPLRFIDRIFALHEAERKWLLSKGVMDEKITVAPNGIEDRFFSGTANRGGKKKIIFIGRINKSKGLGILLGAFSKIKGRSWKLRLVGPDGGDMLELKALAKKLGISNKVAFEGEVTDKKLLDLLDDSEIFVLPSEYEPFGIALVEAMARGKACIAINAGGPREIITNGKNGILANYDENSLSAALDRLIASARLRKTLGLNAKKAAKKYRWREIAATIEAEYKKMVQK